jgi:hypothetical protein
MLLPPFNNTTLPVVKYPFISATNILRFSSAIFLNLTSSAAFFAAAIRFSSAILFCRSSSSFFF